MKEVRFINWMEGPGRFGTVGEAERNESALIACQHSVTVPS